MPVDLYWLPGSAPCRSVLLAAKALGVEVNTKVVDLMKGEHMTPEFLKMNPQHTIPTIDDNGFYLHESRAILGYLVQKYGKDDSLYPKDPKKRAIVDQRLYFDMGTLYQRFGDYYYPVIFGSASFDPEKKKKMDEAMGFLNTFIGDSAYAAGDKLTIADLALVATVSTYDVADYDLTPYPNVKRWFEKVKATAPDYEEANGKNVLAFKVFLEGIKEK